MANLTLVVGATGSVGKKIVLRLRRNDANVRAVVRGGSGRSEACVLSEAGAEIVDGDLIKGETLEKACAGVHTVVCTATSMPQGKDDGLRRIDLDGTLMLMAMAEKAAVKKFVYLSYSGGIRQESPLETAKRACEKRLLASSMRAIILRPTCFVEMWLSPALGFDPSGGTVRIYGSGQAPVSYISASDVADFAVATALGHQSANEILELGGPEPISQLQAVHIFENVMHKKIAVQHVPIEALKQQHESADPLQKTLAALCLGLAAGDVIPAARDNAARYGVKLHSVQDYARSFAEH